MSLGLILLGLVGWTLGLLLVLVLTRMVDERGRNPRRNRRDINPHSVNTLTRLGKG